MVHAQSSASQVHVPWFVAGPGQTDVLLILMAVFLVLFVFKFGVLMLRLHHLPEQRLARLHHRAPLDAPGDENAVARRSNRGITQSRLRCVQVGARLT